MGWTCRVWSLGLLVAISVSAWPLPRSVAADGRRSEAPGIAVVTYRDGAEEKRVIGGPWSSQARLPGYVPPDLSRGAGDKGLEQVTNTSAYPWSTVCHLVALDGNNVTWNCSGAMADSFHVLTAGHCLLSGTGWRQAVAVICGQDQGYHPFGVAWSSALTVSDDWYNNPSDWNDDQDWGWVTLDRQKGDSTGWAGLGWSDDCGWFEGQFFNLAGYPGNYCSQDCMFHDYGVCYDCDETLMYLYVQNFGGMSGGPFWLDDGGSIYKVGINRGYLAKNQAGDEWRLPADVLTLLGDDKAENALGPRFTSKLIEAFQEAWRDDSSPPNDSASDWCAGNGFPDRCCMTDDPCGWAGNGVCDCSSCSWDAADCSDDGGGDGAPDCGVICGRIGECAAASELGLSTYDQCVAACQSGVVDVQRCAYDASDCEELRECFGLRSEETDEDEDCSVCG